MNGYYDELVREPIVEIRALFKKRDTGIEHVKRLICTGDHVYTKNEIVAGEEIDRFIIGYKKKDTYISFLTFSINKYNNCVGHSGNLHNTNGYNGLIPRYSYGHWWFDDNEIYAKYGKRLCDDSLLDRCYLGVSKRCLCFVESDDRVESNPSCYREYETIEAREEKKKIEKDHPEWYSVQWSSTSSIG